MTRFANERALLSSTGLTPSAYSSGTAMRRGHISRQGVSRLRHGLVETAWRALPRAPILQAMFDHIAATRGKQRALVAIARRLIGRIRACFRHGTTYAVGTVGEALTLFGGAAWPYDNWGHAIWPHRQRLQPSRRSKVGEEHRMAEALTFDSSRLMHA